MIGIYKITSPNDRIYIGQTINYKNRLNKYKNLKGSKKQIRLHNSFLKYGITNHIFEFIEECTIEELNTKERYYQDLYDVLSKKGLNCYLTHTNELKRIVSEETKKLLVKINSGKNNPMYGKKGILNNKSKKVINIITNEIYFSLTECCDKNNLNPKYMSRWLNGKRNNKTIYKYL
jgi:group I intron endonuclease